MVVLQACALNFGIFVILIRMHSSSQAFQYDNPPICTLPVDLWTGAITSFIQGQNFCEEQAESSQPC